MEASSEGGGMNERVLVCSKCLDIWSPAHAVHGDPVDQAEVINGWRELVDITQ